ncbi:type I-B CRISPR-associated protein Cas5b [Halocatena pleomorpha]|uniref:Type I-B CRISPR-associated protein Cas5 n=1 Tax=Halocatena pleomorpha TaxID=1785090 RepID=A0A3P3R3I2_9EURY|nr:type I-B CRISPR-associated protein Cas5b [Halocatena pleomorpha]RRJ27528.1 type I-B CRISPR-associated protein Cas5 [Halocatena pleomorpha]
MAHSDASVAIRGTTHIASRPPVINDEGVPSKCLSLAVAGDWGHFRRIDRTVTKQTYRVPPRTTVAGLLAGIVGVGRDGYYDVFAEESSAIAIEVCSELRTVAMPSLGLGTNPSETFDDAGGTGQRTVKVRFPDSTDNRQLHGYHYLVNPVYRIDVAVEDPAFYGTLRHRLRNGCSYYSPTLGLSELLASVEWVGEHEPDPVETNDTVAIDSVLPDGVDAIVPTAGTSYSVERVPGFMTVDSGGRHTTGFINYAFVPDGSPLQVAPDEIHPVNVNDRTVIFR